jgi:glycine hydroxymethyltransferase
LKPDFGIYAKQILENNRVIGETLISEGFDLVSGGSDNHLQLVKLSRQEISGKTAEDELGKVGITVNKNAIPNDPRPPVQTSGIRIGTPAITTRGFGIEDSHEVAILIARVSQKYWKREGIQ